MSKYIRIILRFTTFNSPTQVVPPCFGNSTIYYVHCFAYVLTP